MANELKPAQRVALARNPERPGTAEFVSALFTDFFEQRGDRCCMDDGAIYGGVGLFHGKPVTVIGHRKGHTLEEHVAYHFGMPSPEGYRKAQRLMLQAEKFRRPIVTFIDTAGAYPGLEAEAHGQGEAIASTLARSWSFRLEKRPSFSASTRRTISSACVRREVTVGRTSRLSVAPAGPARSATSTCRPHGGRSTCASRRG